MGYSHIVKVLDVSKNTSFHEGGLLSQEFEGGVRVASHDQLVERFLLEFWLVGSGAEGESYAVLCAGENLGDLAAEAEGYRA